MANTKTKEVYFEALPLTPEELLLQAINELNISNVAETFPGLLADLHGYEAQWQELLVFGNTERLEACRSTLLAKAKMLTMVMCFDWLTQHRATQDDTIMHAYGTLVQQNLPELADYPAEMTISARIKDAHTRCIATCAKSIDGFNNYMLQLNKLSGQLVALDTQRQSGTMTLKDLIDINTASETSINKRSLIEEIEHLNRCTAQFEQNPLVIALRTANDTPFYNQNAHTLLADTKQWLGNYMRLINRITNVKAPIMKALRAYYAGFPDTHYHPVHQQVQHAERAIRDTIGNTKLSHCHNDMTVDQATLIAQAKTYPFQAPSLGVRKRLVF